MNRRGFIPRALAALIAPIAVLSAKDPELMVIYGWDFGNGTWSRCRMQDLHIWYLFRMFGPDGEPHQDGAIYQAVSEPYIFYEGEHPDGSLLNNPTWGISTKIVKGDMIGDISQHHKDVAETFRNPPIKEVFKKIEAGIRQDIDSLKHIGIASRP